MALSEKGVSQAQENPTLDTNKALVHRVFADVINEGRLDIVSELYAPVFPDPTRAARHFPRLAGLPLPLAEFQKRFPDIVATVEAVIAEGDLVATRVRWQHKHLPDSNSIPGCTMHFSRVVNGRITEEWSAGWDSLDLHLTQFFPSTNPLVTP